MGNASLPPGKQLILEKRQENCATCNPHSLTLSTAHTAVLRMIPLRLSVPCGPENKQRICRSKILCFIPDEVQQAMKQNEHAIEE